MADGIILVYQDIYDGIPRHMDCEVAGGLEGEFTKALQHQRKRGKVCHLHQTRRD